MHVMSGRFRVLFIVGLAALGILGSLPVQAARPFRGGAVASEHPIASAAALEMMNKGGNAVDATVAAVFALAVVAPYHSGLGGGGFALVHQASTGQVKVLDFREVAPKSATRDMFQRNGEAVPELSQQGGLSVAVPGAVAGYLELLRTQGKLKPSVVLAPAIRAAREGFWLGPKFVGALQRRLECLKTDPEATRIFLRKTADGTVETPPVGTQLVQADLAKTLSALASQGVKAFYQGRVARAIADSVKSSGGVLSLEDLASYKVRWREPLEFSYRGHRVLTMPPPSAGGLAVLQVLSMMELAGPSPAYRDVDGIHRYVESLRRVTVDRAKYLGDPAFTQVPMAQLTSREYLSKLLASIDMKKATPSSSLLITPAPLPVPSKEAPQGPAGKNTSHVSVIDKEGNAVALTTTVNYGFGSCVVAKGTGVVLNDEMDDFAAKPMTANVYGLVTGEANAVAPGKIPLSSMSPTLVFQKDNPKAIMLSVGSPGGPTIPTTVIQVITNVIDHGMDPVRAVGTGRLHHQYLPDTVWVDRYGLEPATAVALEARGHKLQRMEQWGDAEAVFVDPVTQLRYAGSDPRNEGAAMGQD
jgi:gamma-glutamyltranspeptidase/glutathione hydrolase